MKLAGMVCQMAMPLGFASIYHTKLRNFLTIFFRTKIVQYKRLETSEVYFNFSIIKTLIQSREKNCLEQNEHILEIVKNKTGLRPISRPVLITRLSAPILQERKMKGERGREDSLKK